MMIKHPLPSHTQQVGTILRHELRKLFRSKRVIGITVLATIASIALANLILNISQLNSGNATQVFGIMVQSSPVLMVIAGTLIGSDSLLAEFHEKTGYSLFPNPVSRVAIWFGKFLSCEIVMFVIVSIFFGILAGATVAKFSEFPAGLVAAPFLASFLVATFVISMAFVLSSVFKGPIGATAATLFSLFFMPVLDSLLISQQAPHWFTPFSVVNGIYASIIGGIQSTFPFGQALVNQWPSLEAGLALMAVYITAPCAASIYFFKRRDM